MKRLIFTLAAICLLCSHLFSQQMTNNLKVILKSNNVTLDETVVYFIQGATKHYDFNYDGLKFGYASYSMATETTVDNNKMVFNGLPLLTSNVADTVLIDINFGGMSSSYELSFDRANLFDTDINITLVDAYAPLNNVNVKAGPYAFATNASLISRLEKRFMLIFKKTSNILGGGFITELPVKFLDFTNEVSGSSVNLKWSTASEIDNDHFVIEKSSNGKDYAEVGKVKGAGSSNHLLTYHFTTAQHEAVAYYRIRQVDYNGSFSFSAVLRVRTKEQTASVYPNPASDVLHITLGNVAQNGQISLYNMQGQLVKEDMISNGLYADLTLDHLVNGLYMLTITDETGMAKSFSIVKQ